jgi:hypothetical protein
MVASLGFLISHCHHWQRNHHPPTYLLTVTGALDGRASKAEMLGADAVLNLRFYYLVLGKDNGMMMVAVSGTAVQLTASIGDEKAARSIAGEEKADDEIDDLNGLTYFVEIEGRKLGPFSKWQIRELHTAGRIGTETEIQAGADGKILKVGEVLNGI